MKNYRNYEMKIVLFEGEAWMDVVTSYDITIDTQARLEIEAQEYEKDLLG